MRLIDADKIRYSDMSDGKVPGGLWYTFIENVRQVPTVEAIPIEWIEKYIKVNPSVKIFLEIMLMNWEDWRKENDHRESD